MRYWQKTSVAEDFVNGVGGGPSNDNEVGEIGRGQIMQELV